MSEQNVERRALRFVGAQPPEVDEPFTIDLESCGACRRYDGVVEAIEPDGVRLVRLQPAG